MCDAESVGDEVDESEAVDEELDVGESVTVLDAVAGGAVDRVVGVRSSDGGADKLVDGEVDASGDCDGEISAVAVDDMAVETDADRAADEDTEGALEKESSSEADDRGV